MRQQHALAFSFSQEWSQQGLSGTPFIASTYDGTSMGGRYVILGGLTDEVCKAIQKQTNQVETIPTNPNGANAGCAVMNSNRFVFVRI